MAVIPTTYIQVPFAEEGDKTAIPFPSQVSGAVSYSDGWTAAYEAPDTDPTVRDVPRQQSNQVLNDLSTIAQQYQVWGTPNYINPSQTGVSPAPFAYDLGARVLYNDGTNGPRVFESNVTANTDLPVLTGSPLTISPKWILRDSVAANATVFNNVTFDTGVVNGNAVYLNISNPSVPIYSLALANGAQQQQMVGIADVTNSRVLGFGVVPGLTSLTIGTVYYLSTTSAGALQTTKPPSNAVQVGIAQSATTLLMNIQQEVPGSSRYVGEIISSGGNTADIGCVLCDGTAYSRTTYAALFTKIGTLWGVGNGTTTFNVPSLARLGLVGMGGSSSAGPGITVGNTFTSQLQSIPTSALPAHSHGITDPGHKHTTNAAGDGPAYVAGPGSTPPLAGTTDTSDAATGITINSAGAGSATLNTYGPSAVVMFQIFTGVF